MTHEQIASMVASIGLPYAYYQFPEGTGQATPFVVYFYSENDDVYADQTNYVEKPRLNIELYTSEKEFELEAVVEKTLNDNGLTYYKESEYIGSEKMWQIAYETEVIING